MIRPIFEIICLTGFNFASVSAVEGESSDPTISAGGITALVLLVVFSVVLLGSCVYQSRKATSAEGPQNRILRCGGCRRAFRVPSSVDGAEFMCSRCVTEGRRRMSFVLEEERMARFEKMRESANKPVQLQRVTSTFFKLARGSKINIGGSASSSKILGTPNTSSGDRSGQSTPEALECKICFDDESCIVLLPCGHGSLCEGCAKDLVTATKECYICRTEIELIAKIRKPSLRRVANEEVVASSSRMFDEGHISACLVAPDTLHHLTSRLNTMEESFPSRRPTIEGLDETVQPALEMASSRRSTHLDLSTLPDTIVEEPRMPAGLGATTVETV